MRLFKFVMILFPLAVLIFQFNLAFGFSFPTFFQTTEEKGFERYKELCDCVNEFDSDLDSSFKQRLKNYITKLKKNDQNNLLDGFKSYIDFDKIDEIKVYTYKEGSVRLGTSGGCAKTAAHFVNGKLIVFDLGDFKQAPDHIQDILIMHEFLSAMGMDDESVQFTLFLAWTLHLPNENQQNLLNNIVLKDLRTPLIKNSALYKMNDQEEFCPGTLKYGIRIAGGTTSIGGSGDWGGIALKWNILNKVKEYFDKQFIGLEEKNKFVNQVKYTFIVDQILKANIVSNMGYGISYNPDGSIKNDSMPIKFEYSNTINSKIETLDRVLMGVISKDVLLKREDLMSDTKREFNIKSRESLFNYLFKELLEKNGFKVEDYE